MSLLKKPGVRRFIAVFRRATVEPFSSQPGMTRADACGLGSNGE